jgi:tRNA threonylcarbamoyladenosine modification (KEOPS) complex  Pcc1 subunit
MKGTLIIIVLFLVVSPVLGELTKEDLQAIETIIEKSEARTKEHIDSKHNQVTIKIDEMDKRLTVQIDGVDKRLVDMRSFLIGLMALIAVAIGVPAWIWNKSQQSNNRPAPRENQTDKHVPLNDSKFGSDTPVD